MTARSDCSGPGQLPQQVRAAQPERVAQRQGCDQHVVELADDGDEVGHQVDRD